MTHPVKHVFFPRTCLKTNLEEWLTVSLNYFDKSLENFPGFHYTSFFAIHYFVKGGAVIHDETPGIWLVTLESPYIAMNHELIHDNLNLLKRFVERHLLPSFQVIFFLRGSAFEFYMDYSHRQAPSPYQLVYLVQRAGYNHSFYLTKKLVRGFRSKVGGP